MLTELVPGMQIPKDDNFDQMVVARKFWHLSYIGGHNYIIGKDANNQAILQAHRRESEAAAQGLEKDLSYRERLRRATLSNYLKQTLDQYVGYVFKDQITRAQQPVQYTEYLQNFDGKFSTVNKFMRATLLDALIVGCTYVFCQAVTNTVITTVQQAKLNLQFKVDHINPDNVIYKCVENGIVQQAIVLLNDETAMYVDAERIVTFTINGETIGVIISDEKHGFNQCPLLAITVDTLTPNLAEQQKAIFNVDSLLDEESTNCTFSQWVFHGVDPSSIRDNKDIKVGSDRILWLPPTNGVVSSAQVIGAAPEQAESLRKTKDMLVSGFYRVAGLKSPDPMTANGSESGVAKAFNFVEVASRLAGFAEEMQRVERLITKMWQATTNVAVPAEATYPSEYGLKSSDDVLADLEKILALNVPNVIKRKQVLEYQQYKYELNAQEIETMKQSLLIKFPDETSATATIVKPNSSVNGAVGKQQKEQPEQAYA